MADLKQRQWNVFIKPYYNFDNNKVVIGPAEVIRESSNNTLLGGTAWMSIPENPIKSFKVAKDLLKKHLLELGLGNAKLVQEVQTDIVIQPTE